MSEETSSVSVNWLTDRVDDDITKNLEDLKYNLLGMFMSDLGENFDSILSGTIPKELSTKSIEEKIERKVIFDNSIIKNKNGNNSHFSPGATIAALAMHYSEFVIPPDILSYIKEHLASEEEINLYMKRIPKTEEQYQNGKRFFDILIQLGFPSQSAYLLCGAIWVECVFNANLYNRDEAKGSSGTVKSAQGMANCGEGIFGLTFWSQKLKLIKALSLDTQAYPMYGIKSNGSVDKNIDIYAKVANTQQGYDKIQDGYGRLYQLKEDTWIKLLEEYIKGINKLAGDDKSTYEYIMYDGRPNPNSTNEEDEDHKIFYSCYLFKAATGAGRTFKNTKTWAEKYMATHKKIAQGKGKDTKVDNGFVKQVLVAYALSLYNTGSSVEEINFDNLING